MSELEIRVVTWDAFLAEIQAIRRTVFQEEQGVDAALEFDGLDDRATHLLGSVRGEAVGTARIRDLGDRTFKIERLAVLKAARHRGIGSQLMRKAIALARVQQADCVVIHAQQYVKQMYQNLGFEPVGEPFVEAGIVHLKMILKF